MLVSLEDSGGLERRLRIQVPSDRVEKAIDSRLRSVGKGAKLKGFRPGKVPIKVIRQHYGEKVRQEVLGEFIQSSYSEVITEQKLNPAGGPRIEPESMEPGKDLEYTAVIELYPEIDLDGVSDIKVERSAAKIVDKDMDRMLSNLQQQRTDWVEVDRAAKDSDRVTIDFEGTTDGEAFEGGSAKDLPVELGAKKMLADFEKGLNGIKAGEERSIKVKFPKDYLHAEMAGKKAIFEVVAHKVEEPQLPEIDEEFCKAYGVEDGSLDTLKEEIQANMKRERDEVVQRQVRQQLIDQIVKATEFELPNTLVEDEINRLQRDAASRQPEIAPAPSRELFAEEGKRRVKLGLIINEIVRSEKLELDNDRVRAKVMELASGYEQPEELVRTYMSNPQLMQSVESSVLEDQAFDWLLEQSKVKEVKTTFAELMNFDS